MIVELQRGYVICSIDVSAGILPSFVSSQCPPQSLHLHAGTFIREFLASVASRIGEVAVCSAHPLDLCRSTRTGGRALVPFLPRGLHLFPIADRLFTVVIRRLT